MNIINGLLMFYIIGGLFAVMLGLILVLSKK